MNLDQARAIKAKVGLLAWSYAEELVSMPMPRKFADVGRAVRGYSSAADGSGVSLDTAEEAVRVVRKNLDNARARVLQP